MTRSSPSRRRSDAPPLIRLARRAGVIVGVGLALLAATTPARAHRPYQCDAAELRGWNLYRCLGAVRSRPGIVAELARPRRYPSLTDVVRQAGQLRMREAIPHLRALLARPPDPWLRVPLAAAMADLEDRASAPALVAILRQSESGGSLWDAVLESLGRLDPAAALAYARDALRRTTEIQSTAARHRLGKLLPLVIAGQATNLLPLVRQWSGRDRVTLDLTYAHLQEARLRLGDEPLRRQVRAVLAVRDARVPVHPERYVGGLGDSPEDAPALVRLAGAPSPEGRAAYDAIDRLAVRLTTALRPPDRPGPKVRGVVRPPARRPYARPAGLSSRKAHALLVSGLTWLTRYREDRKDRTFSHSLLSRHHASLAALGVTASRRRLVELIAGDPGTAHPWVAAERALALGLPGALDATAGLIRRSVKVTDNGAIREYKAALLRRAAGIMAVQHAGWTVMVLDWNPIERERAVHHLARLQPLTACGLVTAAADDATEDAVHDGLLALTVLGDRCRPDLEALARDLARPVRVRGMALEVLAMLRAPAVPGLAATLERVAWARGDLLLGASIARARRILAARP